MDVDCSLRGVTAKSGRAQILHDSDINAFNSFDQPDQITVKPHEVAVQGSGRSAHAPRDVDRDRHSSGDVSRTICPADCRKSLKNEDARTPKTGQIAQIYWIEGG